MQNSSTTYTQIEEWKYMDDDYMAGGKHKWSRTEYALMNLITTRDSTVT